MKICVLGNSHVASLKLGLDKLSASQKNVEMVFFASRGGALGALRLEGHRLVPANDNLAKAIAHTSGGKSEVALDEYDAFLVYGLGFRLPVLGRNLSAAVSRQACRDTATASLNYRICTLLRRATDKSIHLGHEPQEAAGQKSHRASDGLPYETVLEQMERELLGDGLKMVAQPRQTLADDWFTIPKFSAGSSRLDIGDAVSNELHPDADTKHMNADFGRMWLENFLARLSAETHA